MLHDLLIDIITKWRISDLILLGLLALTFSLTWLIVLFTGFRILNVKVEFKHSIPGVLFLACISLFLKPFTPGALAFFILLIPLLYLLKFYGKVKWTAAFLVSSILFLSMAIFPMLLISPLSSSNHNLESFFFKNKYGMLVINFMEAFGTIILLAILNIFKIAMLPSPGKTGFIDSLIFGGLLFICYYLFMLIWESTDQFLIMPCVAFMVAAGILVAFCLRKVNEQKSNEKKDQEYQELDQEYQRLKESKLDPETLTSFSNMLVGYVNSLNSFELPSIGNISLDVKFTNREKDIIRLIAQGYSNEEIAKTLYLNPDYVSNVIVTIRSKIGLTDRDRSKLVIFAINWTNRNKN